MNEAVVVDAVRSPVGRGRPGGALSGLHPTRLLGQVLLGLLDRTGVDPAAIEDVLTGCVSQVGEQGSSPGRMAWLGAGLPEHVPAATIDRRCGSGQQAIHFAAQAVMAGVSDLVIACGVESMSRVPMGAARRGADPFGPDVRRRYHPGLVPQGVSAELVAHKWGLDRETLDDYAATSHRRAAARAADGRFAREIVPITVPEDTVPEGTDEDADEQTGARPADGTVVVDETIRPGTTVEALAGLSPSFRTEPYVSRFPELSWHMTAGNSSQIADGAAAVLIASAARADALGLRPRAVFRAFGVAADDPILMLTGPLPATRRLFDRAGPGLDEIDHVEVNEAFAPVPLAWAAEFGVDLDRVNPCGGAIALGHPLGASGVRLLTTMLGELDATGGRYGLQVMCESGGMANALLVERV